MTTPQTSPETRLSRNKKILIGVVAALLLLVTSLAIYAILVGPSKQPYRDALAQYRNVYNANVAFTNSGSAINATTASDEQFAQNIETVEKALNSLKVENEALGEQPVIQEGEASRLYVAFSDRLAQYLAYNQKVIDSIETLRPVLLECSQKMNAISEDEASATALRNCANQMATVENVPDPDYAQLIRSFKASYTNAAQATSEIIALNDRDGADKARYTALTAERDENIENLNVASTLLSKSLQESRNEVDITESAMALDRYLNRQASIF